MCLRCTERIVKIKGTLENRSMRLKSSTRIFDSSFGGGPRRLWLRSNDAKWKFGALEIRRLSFVALLSK
jgi:hypothetical protein